MQQKVSCLRDILLLIASRAGNGICIPANVCGNSLKLTTSRGEELLGRIDGRGGLR